MNPPRTNHAPNPTKADYYADLAQAMVDADIETLETFLADSRPLRGDEPPCHVEPHPVSGLALR